MNFTRRSVLAVVVSVVVTGAGLAGAGAASARDCGTYTTFEHGDYARTLAYGSASCGFAYAAADRFWSRSGVPRRLRVHGTRLSYRGHESGASWQFWYYTGVRRGRHASVFFAHFYADEDAPSSGSYEPPATTPTISYSPPTTTYSAPTIPYPGRGYPVICTDGWLSYSGGIQGACSHHGGIA